MATKLEIDTAKLKLLNAKATAAKLAANPKATMEQKNKANAAVNAASAQLTALIPAPVSVQQTPVDVSAPLDTNSILKYGAIGLGVLGAGFVGYKLFTRKKK